MTTSFQAPSVKPLQPSLLTAHSTTAFGYISQGDNSSATLKCSQVDVPGNDIQLIVPNLLDARHSHGYCTRTDMPAQGLAVNVFNIFFGSAPAEDVCIHTCTWVLVTISLALSWDRTHPGCSSTRFLNYVDFRACDSKSHRCHRLGTPNNDKNSCSADSLALVKTTNNYHTEDLILRLFAASLDSMPTNISLFGAGY
ncbi:hypothetical protein I7I51_03254 [Histoplasma capsulatum]|uniref:Uncharacterized protein n=1 Tax=Ajellomyces capsulatus TaxID=5037 RepID=A0A8A1M9B1_AJECA|nr:hypothetical protein I7I51_03254 [Histoplasma capsulatum]